MMSEQVYVSRVFTEPFSFTASIEGPACDSEGNVYAVNYEKNQTIGKITMTDHINNGTRTAVFARKLPIDKSTTSLKFYFFSS